ncbi:ankyrin repeat-containing domain, PGG domain protein [Artemisia annua]|uniref:Ankyrin repeat-containing domain, PGG domain protein n=1 Tax=Artemisia annua TaxID=35608 RepID=A0A2U1M3C4_ARTAN|nr:ankyrin repeat-containing domain, PGG domain protein [Artemisia annua]
MAGVATAIMNRHQDIYHLMYEIGSMKDLITPLKDKDGNNMLHLVGLTLGKTATKTSRASLLMQRELLWFKV